MTDNDALDRLRKRQRPTVPNRDVSLNPATNSASPDIEISRHPESLEPVDRPPSSAKQQAPESAASPQVAEALPALKTKQTTLRMEKGLSERLQALCRGNGLSREVLIEAMFEYCECHPESLEAVLAAAQEKYEYRQKVANQKRARSMLERFGK